LREPSQYDQKQTDTDEDCRKCERHVLTMRPRGMNNPGPARELRVSYSDQVEDVSGNCRHTPDSLRFRCELSPRNASSTIPRPNTASNMPST